MSKRVRQSDPAKERYWRGVVQGHGASGQSVRAYCRQAGVKESAFYWWRRELARRGSWRNTARQSTNSVSPQSGTVSKGTVSKGTVSKGTVSKGNMAAQQPGGKSRPFLPIRVWADRTAAVPADHAATVEIDLGDGRMVRVGPDVDRQTLVEVLAALEARPC